MGIFNHQPHLHSSRIVCYRCKLFAGTCDTRPDRHALLANSLNSPLKGRWKAQSAKRRPRTISSPQWSAATTVRTVRLESEGLVCVGRFDDWHRADATD
jgi:hypothetical protein